MEIGKTLYVINRKKWREWLRKNHKNEKDIWLIFFKKESGKPRLPYNDAVEEALCYGWIDSIVKKNDGEKFAQRFSPRKKNSFLSDMNKERICKLTFRALRCAERCRIVPVSRDKSKKDFHTFKFALPPA